MRKLLIERREFVEMGGEEAEGMDLGSDVPVWVVSESTECIYVEYTHSEIAQARPNPSYVEVPSVYGYVDKSRDGICSALTSAEFIDDDKGVLCSGLKVELLVGRVRLESGVKTYSKNRRGLEHLSHEGGDPFQLAVSCSHTTKYGIEYGYLGFRTWNERSRLSHERNHSNLADVS
jgi:hypothetical protein